MANGQYIGVNGVARKVVSPYVGVEGVARNVKNGYVGVDGVARLFFAPDDGGAVVLEVEKITSDTYANETTYTAEEFILLDIYPKTGGTVNVTYGGLTKTITDTSGAEEPNGQQVFFGTFNGISDSVETPSSGELTIEGDYRCFGCGMFSSGKSSIVYWSGITGIIEWGNSECIGTRAFYECDKVIISELPAGVTTIEAGAFYGCDKVTISELPAGVKTIGMNAFRNSNFVLGPNFFGSEIVSIGPCAFSRDTKITGTVDIILPETLTELGEMAFAIVSIAGTRYAIFDGTVTLLAKTPPTIVVSTISTTTEPIGPFGSAASDNPNITIIVPKGCGEAYKAADGWSEYANHIVEAT